MMSPVRLNSVDRSPAPLLTRADSPTDALCAAVRRPAQRGHGTFGGRMNQGAISPFVHNVESSLAGRTILQIIPQLHAGGAERTTIDIAEALTDVGARALVACAGGRLVSELQAKGGLWIPVPANSKNPPAIAFHVGQLIRLVPP